VKEKGEAAMSPHARDILAEALKLSPIERAELLEQIVESFSSPDRRAFDERWAAEAEERIEAYERGEIKSSSANEVFDRIERGDTR
jgi:putative addiction module component (TIGR02574 family)